MSFIPQQDWLTEVSKGNIPNHETLIIRGLNTDVGTSFETVWPEGGIKVFQSAASIQTLSSDNANDTLLGTGARIVTVRGLLSDHTEASEDVEMDGLTGVSTLNSYLRINEVGIKAGESGSSGFNEGIVYVGTGVIMSGKPAVVVNLIPINSSISQSAFFTIPAGKKLLSYSRSYGVDAGRSAIIVGTLVEQGTKYSTFTVPITQNLFEIIDSVPLSVDEKIDIIFTAISTSGGGSSADITIRANNILYTPNA